MIANKFVTGDDAGDPYGCAKLGANTPMEGFCAHGWNRSKIICIYTPFENSPTSQTRQQMFTHNGSNDADWRKDEPLLGIFSYNAPFRGSKPQNHQFWGVNRRFQAKLAKSKNVHDIIKTTASIPTTFCTVIETTKFPSWVVPTRASRIQDGRRPPSSKNLHISAAVREILAKFCTVLQFDFLDCSER